MSYWDLRIPGWTPPSVNRLLTSHWSRAGRIKRSVRDEIALARSLVNPPIPDASGKRRVLVYVVVSGRGGLPDPDNVLKCLMDGLKSNRLIVDDSAKFLEIGDVAVCRGDARKTVITLEDIP